MLLSSASAMPSSSSFRDDDQKEAGAAKAGGAVGLAKAKCVLLPSLLLAPNGPTAGTLLPFPNPADKGAGGAVTPNGDDPKALVLTNDSGRVAKVVEDIPNDKAGAGDCCAAPKGLVVGAAVAALVVEHPNFTTVGVPNGPRLPVVAGACAFRAKPPPEKAVMLLDRPNPPAFVVAILVLDCPKSGTAGVADGLNMLLLLG